MSDPRDLEIQNLAGQVARLEQEKSDWIQGNRVPLSRFNALAGQVAALRDAFAEYADHRKSCYAADPGTHWTEQMTRTACDCGLTQVTAGVVADTTAAAEAWLADRDKRVRAEALQEAAETAADAVLGVSHRIEIGSIDEIPEAMQTIGILTREACVRAILARAQEQP